MEMRHFLSKLHRFLFGWRRPPPVHHFVSSQLLDGSILKLETHLRGAEWIQTIGWIAMKSVAVSHRPHGINCNHLRFYLEPSPHQKYPVKKFKALYAPWIYTLLLNGIHILRNFSGCLPRGHVCLGIPAEEVEDVAGEREREMLDLF